MNDVQLAKRYGIFSLPTIVYYENGIPNVYDEDMTKTDVLSWLEDQKTGSFIEKVKSYLLSQKRQLHNLQLSLFVNLVNLLSLIHI